MNAEFYEKLNLATLKSLNDEYSDKVLDLLDHICNSDIEEIRISILYLLAWLISAVSTSTKVPLTIEEIRIKLDEEIDYTLGRNHSLRNLELIHEGLQELKGKDLNKRTFYHCYPEDCE